MGVSLGNLGSPGGLEALGFLRVSEATYISLGFGTFFLMNIFVMIWNSIYTLNKLSYIPLKSRLKTMGFI